MEAAQEKTIRIAEWPWASLLKEDTADPKRRKTEKQPALPTEELTVLAIKKLGYVVGCKAKHQQKGSTAIIESITKEGAEVASDTDGKATVPLPQLPFYQF